MSSLRSWGMIPLLLLVALALPAAALDTEEELIFLDKLHEDGLHDLAVREMGAFLQRNPAHARAADLSYTIVQSELVLERYGDAMAGMLAFADNWPADPRVCEGLYEAAERGARAGRLREAAPLLERILRENADCEEYGKAVLLSARIRRAEADRAGALQLLGWLIENVSDAELLGKALFERADLRAEEDPASARRDLEVLKGSLPDHPMAGFAALRLARLLHGAGEDDPAARELEWILARFQERELVLGALQLQASWREEAGDRRGAAASLAAIRRRFPERADLGALFVREVELLLEAGEQAGALQRAEAGLAGLPGDIPLTALRAKALEAGGRGAEAAGLWRRLREDDPDGAAGLQARWKLFDHLVIEDSRSELPALAAELLERETRSWRRCRVRLELGRYYKERSRSATALRTLEALDDETSRGAEYQESLYLQALLHEEAGRWTEAEALLDRLQLEFGGSAWGLRARERLDALLRFHKVDYAVAVDSLLALLGDRRSGFAREMAIGGVFSGPLKQFARASEHFERLALQSGNSSTAAEARYEAGRAASAESRLRALSGREDQAAAWREKAESFLTQASRDADPNMAERIDRELTLLRIEGVKQPLDRLPLLQLYLDQWAASEGAGEIYLIRGEILREAAVGESRPEQLGRALGDFQSALAGGPPPHRRFTLHLALARTAQELELSDLAVEHYSLLEEQAGQRYEGVEARYGLGELAEGRRAFREALGRFEAYLEMAPGSPRIPRALIHLGDCHFFLRDWESACRAYARLVEEYPDDPFADDAVFRWSLASERRGDPEDQGLRLEWLAENGSERFRREAYWRLAALAEDDPDEREQQLGRLLAMGWTGRYALDGGLALSALYLDAGRGTETLALVDSLLALGAPGEERPLLEARRIRALLLVDRSEDAQSAWEALRAGSPPGDEESAAVLLAFGRWHGRAGRPAEAQRWFSLCLESHAGSETASAVAYESALLEAQAGRIGEALRLFDDLLDRHPGSTAARRGAFQAGGILYNRGEWGPASERFEKAVAWDSDPDAQLLYWSALALEKVGRPETALERIQALLARWPEDQRVPEAMMKAGYFLHQMGQFDRALLAYRSAEFFQDREGKARLHFWIADCQEAMGDMESAVAGFLKVSYLYSDQGMWGVTSTLRAALASEKLGDHAQARQLFDKVLRSQGEDSDFGRTAKAGLERLGGGG